MAARRKKKDEPGDGRVVRYSKDGTKVTVSEDTARKLGSSYTDKPPTESGSTGKSSD